jgi:nitrite reductase (NADH) small subunit
MGTCFFLALIKTNRFTCPFFISLISISRIAISFQAMASTRIATQSELPAVNTAKEFPCGEKTVCIANVNGVYSAMDNVCLHQGGPLGEGTIEHSKVVCPWHGWQYDPQTGEVVHNPRMKIAVYPMKIENADVLVEV